MIGSFPLQVINTVGIDFGAGNDGSEADAIKGACEQGKGTAQLSGLGARTVNVAAYFMGVDG